MRENEHVKVECRLLYMFSFNCFVFGHVWTSNDLHNSEHGVIKVFKLQRRSSRLVSIIWFVGRNLVVKLTGWYIYIYHSLGMVILFRGCHEKGKHWVAVPSQSASGDLAPFQGFKDLTVLLVALR
jgi:hypothetical protein